LTFLLVQQIAQAPAIPFYLPKGRIAIKFDYLDKYLKDSKEKFEEIKKEHEKRLVEERKKEEERELKNYITHDFNLDSDELLLARMIFGEGESCTKLEKIKIAWTAINRRNLGYGKTLKEIILSPYQYSCFNEELDSSIFLKNPLMHNSQQFLESLQIAKEVLTGRYSDPTRGAVSYYNPNSIEEPSWAKTMKRIEGNKEDYHFFYRK